MRDRGLDRGLKEHRVGTRDVVRTGRSSHSTVATDCRRRDVADDILYAVSGRISTPAALRQTCLVFKMTEERRFSGFFSLQYVQVTDRGGMARKRIQ